MQKSIVIGSVAYDPKVVTIWEGIKQYFQDENVPFDFVLFSNYEAQVEALFSGFIDFAWNTNLAYVKVDRRLGGKAQALVMRDTDLGFTTRIIVPSGSAVKTLKDLNGKRFAFGSRDSAQAAIIPEFYLRKDGLEPGKHYEAIRFNTDLGKHGDTGRSEVDVVDAVQNGKADAGAIGETMWQALLKNNPSAFQSIWTSPPYSHCNFTALPLIDPEKAELFVSTLLKMDYNIPAHRVILDMEGLTRWVRGEREGYASVFEAVDATGYLAESNALTLR